jgi:hypothetical protein
MNDGLRWQKRSDSIDRAVMMADEATSQHEEYLAGWDAGAEAITKRVADWAERHAVHAGHAPLAELHKLLMY